MDHEIIYSKRKTLGLEVKPDLRIIVRAPYRLDKKYIDNFVMSKSDWINRTLEKLSSRTVNPYRFSDVEINEMKKKTLSVVIPKVEYYSSLMNVKPKRISASSDKRRFASCSSKGTLSFSFRLCLYPEEAIDYVVVHELAHMKEMNHSKSFWALVAQVCPGYALHRKWLKQNGRALLARLPK